MLPCVLQHWAIVNRNPPQGVIHHFDRGIQYAAHDYVEALLKYDFLMSISEM